MSVKSTSKNSQKNSLPLKELNGTPTLVISSKLQQHIDLLHMKTGSKEWSGPLVYRVLQGDINDPDNLYIRAEGIFLMDVGTSGGTDFEMSGEDTVELYDTFPQLQEGEARIGLIHSHHDMRVYFSGVDSGELKDNAEDYNAYLSLIVGFNIKPKARIAFISEVKETKVTHFTYKNMSDELLEGSEENSDTKKVVHYYDCDVRIEFDHVEDSFIQRYDMVKERSKKNRKSKKVGYNKNGKTPPYYNRNQKYYNNNYNNKNNYNKSNTYKYTLEEIETFLCKICSFNPHSNTKHLTAMLKTLNRTNATVPYLTSENLINITEECIGQVFSSNEVSQMDIQDRYDLFDECIEFLESSKNDKKSLASEYEAAKQVVDSFTEIMDWITKTTEEDDEFTWY